MADFIGNVSSDRDGWFSKLISKAGNADRAFSSERLGIERSLTGNDEIGLLDPGREIEGFCDKIKARMEFGPEKIHQAET